MKQAYSYSRLSSGQQVKGAGLARQVEMAETYCKVHNLALSPVTFRDLGVSGFSGANVKKGALGAFIRLVEQGKIPSGSALILEQWDRWSRQSPMDALADLQRLLRLGVEIHTTADQKVYTKESLANVADLLYSVVVMSRAYDESLTKSRRGLDNWKRKRAIAATKPLTKMCPGWLSWDGAAWKVNAGRAAIVHRVFSLVSQGYGRHAIARLLNAERVPLPTRRGTSWHAGTVFKLLASASVIGQMQPGRRDGTKRIPDGDPIDGYYPGIISRSLWLKTRPAGVQFPLGPQTGTPNLFATLLRCGRCRGPLHRVYKGAGVAYIQCAKSRRGLCTANRGWHYDRFEALVTALLHRAIKWSALVPSATAAHKSVLVALEERQASLEVDRESVRLKLVRVTEAVEAGAAVKPLLARMMALENTRQDLVKDAENVRSLVDAERERLRNVRADAAESKMAFAEWKRDDPEQRHRLAVVLRRLLKALVLTATTRQETRRLEIVFRDGDEETFVITPDLREAYTVSGEAVVSLSYEKK